MRNWRTLLFTKQGALWSALALGALLMLGATAVSAATFPQLIAPVLATDVNQHRLNVALPPPDGRFTIAQTFRPQRAGLYEVELLLIRQDRNIETPIDGTITLSLWNAQNQQISAQTFASATLAHNQPLTLRVASAPPAGELLTLRITGDGNNPITVWGYTLDVYDEGALRLEPGALTTAVPATTAQELRFVTRYRLTGMTAIVSLWQMIKTSGGVLLLALLFLPLPGAWLLWLARRRLPLLDSGAWWGLALALGTAVWPLLWFWLALPGGRWTPPRLWIVVVTGWPLLLAVSRFTASPPPRSLARLSLHHLFLLLLLLGALALRLLAVRDMAFPLWVDAGRHGLITAVMTQTGQPISDYGSLLPVDRFPYHYGFHTLAASLQLMSGVDLPELLLMLGQLLNALAPLSVYTAVWLLTRRRDASLIAAYLVAVPFFFPAYYATWGRFTQLSGMLVLPLLVGLTWRVVRGGRRWRRAWWLVGVLAAGLFLIHLRVFLLYLPLALLVWGMSLGRNGRWLAAAGALSGLLVGWRVVQLWQMTDNVSRTVGAAIPGYNAFPTAYYQAGWDRYFIWSAGAGILWVLWAGVRRRSWTAVPLGLIAWVTLLFLALIGAPLGLPETTLINLNSMYITLYFPLAAYLGLLLSRLWRHLTRLPVGLGAVGTAVLGAAFAATLLFGVRQQTGILNTETILAQPPDAQGLAWAAANLPPEAKVAVNSWRWLGSTWAGSDGGAWLVPLTSRQSTTPPADYIYNRELAQQVTAFNETAAAINDWSSIDAAAWLQSEGVTHIFVGARGGRFDPATLARNPLLTAVYSENGVFIFTVDAHE